MSDVAATASISLPQNTVAASAAPVTVSSAGADLAGGQVANSASVASAQSISGSNYSLNISESQATYLSSSVSQGLSEADQRVMMLILALIQILFGSDDDDSKKRNAALGLAAALMQSGQSQQSQEFTYLEMSDFQYSESYSEFQASSAQAASYGQVASTSAGASSASGANLNVTG